MTETLEYTCEDLTVREVTFDADRLSILEAEVGKLNKVARKLDVPEITFTIIGHGVRKKPVEDVFLTAFDMMVVGKGIPTVDVATVTVRIEGLTPMLPGGWKFLGAIEFLDGNDDADSTLVHGDDPRLAPYRAAGRGCDHCKMDRRRKKVVILVDEDGALVKVGSMCLKDFLGYHGNPERVIRFVDDTIAMLDGLGGGGGGYPAKEIPTDVFLAMTAAMVREFGWVAKSAYNGVPTAYRVLDRFFPPVRTKHNADYLAEIEPVVITEADEAKVVAAREWLAEEAAKDPMNNYLGNLRVGVKADNIGNKLAGIVASLIGSFDRAMGVKAEWEIRKAAEEKAKAESEWVGEIGKRIPFSATVVHVHIYENNYGTARIVAMIDGDGNKLKTFTSGAWAYGIETGDVVTGKGTVSEHGEWKGTKETVLKRVAATVTSPAPTDAEKDED